MKRNVTDWDPHRLTEMLRFPASAPRILGLSAYTLLERWRIFVKWMPSDVWNAIRREQACIHYRTDVGFCVVPPAFRGDVIAPSMLTVDGHLRRHWLNHSTVQVAVREQVLRITLAQAQSACPMTWAPGIGRSFSGRLRTHDHWWAISANEGYGDIEGGREPISFRCGADPHDATAWLREFLDHLPAPDPRERLQGALRDLGDLPGGSLF